MRHKYELIQLSDGIGVRHVQDLGPSINYHKDTLYYLVDLFTFMNDRSVIERLIELMADVVGNVKLPSTQLTRSMRELNAILGKG